MLIQCSPDNRIGIVMENGARKITINSPFGITNKQPKKISEFIGDFFFVRLSSLGDNFMGRIEKLMVSNNIIFIHDDVTDSMFLYDMEGNLITRIKGKGKGPNEYAKIVDFTVDWDRNRIVILDNITRKIILYDFNGHVIGNKKLHLFSDRITYLGNDKYAFYNDYNSAATDNYLLRITDLSQKGVLSFFPWSDEKYLRHKVSKWQYVWDSNNTEMNLVPFYDNNLYGVTKDSVYARYFFDFGRHNLPEDMVLESFRVEPNYVHTIQPIYETDSILAFGYTISGRRQLVFYNKNNGNQLFARETSWLNEPTVTRMFYANDILACYDNYFVAWETPVSVSDFVKYYPDEFGKNERQMLMDDPKYKELANVQVNDNPILVFYKLKSF
ncbi:6-bladed beta-propeller protein [Anseongella ginsenosidimutans]|uniref:6-bladed beta-propeller protein n=2 Tax=Anseongella ginsenosidimutans TaxID=496056 RepID=A0A4R3KKA8_9SPHI|nr:6-bladed beta-propeller protein [Anseongella ginsenosidimutans]